MADMSLAGETSPVYVPAPPKAGGVADDFNAVAACSIYITGKYFKLLLQKFYLHDSTQSDSRCETLRQSTLKTSCTSATFPPHALRQQRPRGPAWVPGRGCESTGAGAHTLVRKRLVWHPKVRRGGAEVTLCAIRAVRCDSLY